MKQIVLKLMWLCLAVCLVGCGSGGASSTDAPPLAPLAYVGATTDVNISSLTEDQQNILANSATRGVAVAIQYLQEGRGIVLNQLAVVMDKTGIATLAPPAAKTELTNPAPCADPQGVISYYARDAAGRYLVVNFDQVCVPFFATGNAATESPLILNGALVVDSQQHTFTPDNLTILDMTAVQTLAVPVGSYQLNGTALSKLYFCQAGVCKVDAGTWSVANSSYTTPSCSTPGCTVPASTVYDTTFGKVSAVSDQLLPCSSSLGVGLDSPFQSGTLTLTGAAGSLTVTYNGCGQSFTVTPSI